MIFAARWAIVVSVLFLVTIAGVKIWFRSAVRRANHRSTRSRTLWLVLRRSSDWSAQVRAMRELFKRGLGADDCRRICLMIAPRNHRVLGDTLVDLLFEIRTPEVLMVLAELACGAYEDNFAQERASEVLVRQLSLTEKLTLKASLVEFERDERTDYGVCTRARELIKDLATGRNGTGIGVMGTGADLVIEPWNPDADYVEAFLQSLAEERRREESS